MIIDIFVNHLIGHITTGHAEISACPKVPSPIALPQFRKFLLDFPRTPAFHRFYQIAFPDMRGDRDKDMHMIRGHHPIDNMDAKLFCHLGDNLPHTALQGASQHFVPIFGNPHNVIPMMIGGMRTSAVSFHKMASYTTRTVPSRISPVSYARKL